jgi:methanogenic corrinoid protein MtbC1
MPQISEDLVRRFKERLLVIDRTGAAELLTWPDGKPFTFEETEALLVPALERIGQGWEEGRVALSQVYMSGRLCEELMNSLQPSAPSSALARVAIATLEDHHLLGLRLVSSALRATGLELKNYGRQDLGELVQLACDDRVEILLVSVLMLRSALRVRELRAALDREGCCARLVVGGAPFRLDPQLWREVGAEATATSAAGAVAVVRRMLEEAR